MQLHVDLLLFIIFIINKGKTLASSSDPQCGGTVLLDPRPSGHISLSLPGLITSNNNTTFTPSTHHQTEETPTTTTTTPPPLLDTLCTWVIHVPSTQTVLLKLIASSWVDGGAGGGAGTPPPPPPRIWVRCVWDQGGEELVLEETGQTAVLLSGCDRDTASLTARRGGGGGGGGEGGGQHSSSHAVVQLAYYVQEVVRNSSALQSSGSESRPRREGHLSSTAAAQSSQTGTGFTSVTPAAAQQGQEAGSGAAERATGHHLSPGLEWSSVPPKFVSAPSLQDQGRLLPRRPPSPQPGLTVVAGPTDRETPPLPQEEADNGADVSGAARVTQGHNHVRDSSSTHVYFHTQHTLTVGTASRIPSTVTPSYTPHTLDADTLPHMQSSHTVTDTAVDTVVDTAVDTAANTYPSTVIRTGKHRDKRVTTHTPQTDLAVDSLSIVKHVPPSHSQPESLLLTSSSPAMPGETSGTPRIPREGLGDGHPPAQSQSPAWRSQRSTDGLQPAMTLSVTPDVVADDNTPSEPWRNDSNGTDSDIGVTAVSFSQGPHWINQSRGSEMDTVSESGVAVSSHQNISPVDSSTPVRPDDVTSSQTDGFVPSGKFENTNNTPHVSNTHPVTAQSQTDSPQRQHTPSPSSHTLNTRTSSPVTQAAETQHAHNNTRDISDDHSHTTSNTLNHKEFSSTSGHDDNTKGYAWTAGSRETAPPPTTQGDDVVSTVSPDHVFSSSDVNAINVSKADVVDGEESTRGTATNTKASTFNSTCDALLPEVSHTHTTVVPNASTQSPAPLTSAERLHTPPPPTRADGSSLTTGAPFLHPSTSSFASPPTRPPSHDDTHKPNNNNLPTHLPSLTATQKHTYERTLPTQTPQTSTTRSTTTVRPRRKQSPDYVTTTHPALSSHAPPATTEPEQQHTGGGRGGETTMASSSPAMEERSGSGGPDTPPSLTPAATTTTTSGPPGRPPPMTDLYPSQRSLPAGTTYSSPPSSSRDWSSAVTRVMPKFYIVPDQPAALKVETIELLLQILVEDSSSAFSDGLEEYTTVWVESYLQSASGYSRMLGVWSSGLAVQSLVEFRTRGALDWLGMEEGPASLLGRTGLTRAVRQGRSFRGSKVTNITVGGLQGSVCDWLLQCPAGYQCLSQPGTANHSCSSVCHSDYCHHHGICTHHPQQLPVCRCLVGDDFWYVGQRCDMRMTRARLAGTCFAILITMVMLIGILALVAVRRYRAILIQAKVDQTRSSYRKFNHFDELSGRFWLRSWAGSAADSLDNPAFTRSDELLHLRALDRTCCGHDDTMSLASTCPSNGTHLNTVYPHSSQYVWRGSEMSMGECVLDSGKASDLSVCSWPVEPIHWTPFPLLQQLASQSRTVRTPTLNRQLRAPRPRSYCEGMELVDLGKSWTA